MLNNIGLPGLILIIAFLALWIVPMWKLLKKFGIPGWLAIFSVVPLVQLILLWVMALSEPSASKQEAK